VKLLSVEHNEETEGSSDSEGIGLAAGVPDEDDGPNIPDNGREELMGGLFDALLHCGTVSSRRRSRALNALLTVFGWLEWRLLDTRLTESKDER
jgi:hypothetical protein